jgi:glycosyltransferase involved in cell wall biosynthesis
MVIKPDVSVIITYHNEGELLLRAIESVEQQTYRGGVEVLVVDDASDIVPALPPKYRLPVRTIRSEHNIHAGAARNLGLKETTGEFVCYLDADDAFLPRKIEAQVAYLSDHPGVLAVSGPYYIHREGRVWLQVPDVIANCFPDLADRSCVLPDRVRHDVCFHYISQLGAAMFRREALERIGGFDAVYGRFGDDLDLWVRLAQIGTIGYLTEPASRYICRDSGSITTTMNPEKCACGASVVRKWLRTVEGLPRSYRRALRAKQREWHLLAAQIYLEDHCRASRSLSHALQSLICSPSIWGIRSTVRSGLYVLFPWLNRNYGNTARL